MSLLFVPGAPGGPELIIILFTGLLTLGVPILLVVAVYNYLDGKRGYEQRISALEQRVEELESERS